MVQWQVPDREGFKLCVSGLVPSSKFVVDLRQARGHLARSRPRGRYDDQVAAGFDKVITPESLVRYHRVHSSWISLDNAVTRHLQAQFLQLAFKRLGRLVVIFHLRHHDVVNQEPTFAEHVDQPQYVLFVGNAQVGAHLVALEVFGVQDDEDFQVVLELFQHGDLVIRCESGQDTRSVQIVKKLATHFQVKLAAYFFPASGDVVGL